MKKITVLLFCAVVSGGVVQAATVSVEKEEAPAETTLSDKLWGIMEQLCCGPTHERRNKALIQYYACSAEEKSKMLAKFKEVFLAAEKLEARAIIVTIIGWFSYKDDLAKAMLAKEEFRGKGCNFNIDHFLCRWEPDTPDYGILDYNVVFGPGTFTSEGFDSYFR